MAERRSQAWSVTARPRRRRGRGLPWTCPEAVASAAALAALFSAAACGSGGGTWCFGEDPRGVGRALGQPVAA